MEQFMTFGIILLIVLLISICVNYMFHLKERKYLYAKKLVAPPWADQETKQLFQQFNRAWSIDIEKTVNVRVLKAKCTLTTPELRERWYELKKFLFLAGISKGLPMFSKKVDELWHFFLEETELYDAFCFAFIGERIEHHPHEKPVQLPEERAWFDILYLSFFNITSHSKLWGKFVSRKKVHIKWIEKILNDSAGIASLGRPNSLSTHTLASFLSFARKEITKTADISVNRMQRTDGYWYGAVLFSIYGYDFFQEEKEKMTSASSADGGVGFTPPPNPREEWNEIGSQVNTFEAGTDNTASSGSSDGGTDSGGSDSGSSCSSCSGCSS